MKSSFRILLNLPDLNKYFSLEEKPYKNPVERYKVLKEIYPQCSSMGRFCEKAVEFLNDKSSKKL
jgi:hypothetical protein